MCAVDRNVHHGGAFVQLKAGNADQTAYHRLAKTQLIFAVVLDLIACDGAVLDHRFALSAFIRILIGDTGQPAQGVGALIVLHSRATLDDAAVVAVKHDVFDRRARRGAEYAYIVAVGVDGDVLDVVVPAIVLPAEPRVERNTVTVLIHTYRAGDGVEHGILRAIRWVCRVRAVEVVGLGPTPLGASILRTVSCLRALRCVLQIGELLISIPGHGATRSRLVGEDIVWVPAGAHILRRGLTAPVDELELLHGADLVLLFRARLAEVLRVAYIPNRAVGISEEGADGVGVGLPILLQGPCAVSRKGIAAIAFGLCQQP